MPHTMQDLRELMEDRSAGAPHPPDRLGQVRRRIRRGARLRAASAAVGTAGVAVAVGAFLTSAPGAGDRPRPASGPKTVELSPPRPGTPPKEGMAALGDKFLFRVGEKTRLRIVPTGRTTLLTNRCSAEVAIYEVKEGELSGGGCSPGSEGSSSYLATVPGRPIILDLVALPSRAPEPSGLKGLDAYLGAHRPVAAAWSVHVYSGTCTSETCKTPERGAGVQGPPTSGLKRLARTAGKGDGRVRTAAFTPSGRSVRLRVACVDGTAWAIVRVGGGTPRMVGCERAESFGVTWDQKARPGRRTDVDVRVLPAEADPGKRTDPAAIDDLMRGAAPAGTWTLEVYDLP